MTLPGKLLSGFSGVIVAAWDYPLFFVYTTLLGLPAITLCCLLLYREHRGTGGASRVPAGHGGPRPRPPAGGAVAVRPRRDCGGRRRRPPPDARAAGCRRGGGSTAGPPGGRRGDARPRLPPGRSWPPVPGGGWPRPAIPAAETRRGQSRRLSPGAGATVLRCPRPDGRGCGRGQRTGRTAG